MQKINKVFYQVREIGSTAMLRRADDSLNFDTETEARQAAREHNERAIARGYKPSEFIISKTYYSKEMNADGMYAVEEKALTLAVVIVHKDGKEEIAR